MKIGIDARFLGPEGTGLGRYIERLLHHLQDLEQEHEVVVFLRPENESLFTVRNPLFSKAIADARWYTVKEQLLMPRLIAQNKIDLMHFGHFNVTPLSGRRFVVTIHDLIKSDHADRSASTRSALVYKTKHMAYELLVRYAAMNACRVLVPTKFVRQKVIDAFDMDPDNVIVTYEGVDTSQLTREVSEEERQRVLEKYGIDRPFLLYVGNSYPYKNLDLILDALPQLPSEYVFVNPCARSTFYDRLSQNVKERGLENRVVLPGYVPDEDLAVLYASATLYVFPSLSEGFGIPALEAMASGLPVAAASASCLPEVLGDAAAFFDPHDPKAFADTVNQLLSSEEQRAALRVKGVERLKRYSWRKMAEQTRSVYTDCLT